MNKCRELRLNRVQTHKQKLPQQSLQDLVLGRKTRTMIDNLPEARCGQLLELKTPGGHNHRRPPRILRNLPLVAEPESHMKYLIKIPHASSSRREKESFCNRLEHVFLIQPVSMETS